MTPRASRFPAYLILAVALYIALLFLTGCVSSRPDPMPKWKGYQLEFTK